MPEEKKAAEVEDRPGLAGIKDFVLRLGREISDDHVSIAAAGLAFWAMLSIFPVAIAVVSVYGLLSDPHDVERLVTQLAGIVPASTRELAMRQLSQIVGGSSTSLSLGVVFSVIGALWTSSSGTNVLIKSINMAWDTEHTRSFVRERGLALFFTLGMIVSVVITIALVAAVPAILGFVGLASPTKTLIDVLRWPVLGLYVFLGLTALYRWAPNRERPPGSRPSFGALVATLLWLAASFGFSVYVANFGKYNQTYGALGAVIVLLLWFEISGYAILLGAEIDAEIEHRQERRLAVLREREAAPDTARERSSET